MAVMGKIKALSHGLPFHWEKKQPTHRRGPVTSIIDPDRVWCVADWHRPEQFAARHIDDRNVVAHSVGDIECLLVQG